MKQVLTVFLIAIGSFTLTAQTDSYTGTYERYIAPTNAGARTRTLILNPDGTFTFSEHRAKHPSQPEELKSGKGTWKVEKPNVIYFYVDEEKDMDNAHVLNFNNSKARFTQKSPRDKSDRIIPTSIRFYDSEISWIKGMKLLKK